jgi:hypothetical protein
MPDLMYTCNALQEDKEDVYDPLEHTNPGVIAIFSITIFVRDNLIIRCSDSEYKHITDY